MKTQACGFQTTYVDRNYLNVPCGPIEGGTPLVLDLPPNFAPMGFCNSVTCAFGVANSDVSTKIAGQVWTPSQVLCHSPPAKSEGVVDVAVVVLSQRGVGTEVVVGNFTYYNPLPPPTPNSGGDGGDGGGDGEVALIVSLSVGVPLCLFVIVLLVLSSAFILFIQKRRREKRVHHVVSGFGVEQPVEGGGPSYERML
jgi:hypothetical protein